MTPSDLAPVTLMIEMRERLVRIETKMDGAAEKADAQQSEIDAHGDRLTALEAEASQLRSTIGTLRWLGGAGVAFAGFLGFDKIVAFLRLA